MEDVLELQSQIIELINKSIKSLIKSLKKESLSTKSSLLFMEILNESKTLSLYLINLIKAQRDFVQSGQDEEEYSQE